MTTRATQIHWMGFSKDGNDKTFCGKSRRGMPKQLWSYGYKRVTCWKCITGLIQDYRDAGDDETADQMVSRIKKERKMDREDLIAIEPDRQTKREQAYAEMLREQQRFNREYQAAIKERQQEAGRKAAATRRQVSEDQNAEDAVAEMEARKARQQEAGRKAAETRRRNAEMAVS